MNIRQRISNKISRFDKATRDYQILQEVATKGESIDTDTKGFTNNKVKYRHFFFPCRNVDGRKSLV